MSLSSGRPPGAPPYVPPASAPAANVASSLPFPFLDCVRTHLTRPEDTAHDVRAKAVFLSLLFYQALCNLVLLLSGSDVFRTATGAFFSCEALLLIVYLWAFRRLTAGLLRTAVVGVTLNITFVDLGLLVYMIRAWPLFVVLVDVLLYIRAPRWMYMGVIAWVCGYLIFAELELFLRFGVLDAPFFGDYDGRRERCDCERPPCAGSWQRAFSNLIPPLTVFILDYVFSKGRADVRSGEEQAVMTSIRIINAVNRRLAEFDIPCARAVLQDHGEELTPELLESFAALLSKVEAYRSYLPQACIAQGCGDATPEFGPTRGRLANRRGPHHGGHRMGGRDGDADSLASSTSSGLTLYSDDTGSSIPRGGSSGDLVNGASSVASSPAGGGAPVSKQRSLQDSPALSQQSVGSATMTPPESPFASGPRSHGLRQQGIAMLSMTAHFPQSFQALDPTYFTVRQEHILSIVIGCVTSNAGVVDGFVGCKIVASFGAHRANPAPARCGVICALALVPDVTTALPDICATGAVAAGPAVVGVLGTSTMRRPSILGRLPTNLPQMEKYGAIRHYNWLCDEVVYRKTEGVALLRVILDSVGFEPTWASGLSELERDIAAGAQQGAGGGGAGSSSAAGAQKTVLYELLMDGGDGIGGNDYAGGGGCEPASRSNSVERTSSDQSNGSRGGGGDRVGAVARPLDVYNAAGYRYLTRGSDAAYRYLQKHHATPDTWSSFREAVRSSCLVDFTAQVRRKEELFIDSPRRRGSQRQSQTRRLTPLSSQPSKDKEKF